MPQYYKGKFKPKNPGKYLGNPTNIIYRSSWELKLMKYLDEHHDVLRWGSEEIHIHYRSPLDPPGSRPRRYFPDFIAEMRERDGKVRVYIMEVKPYAQTKPPENTRKKTKKFISESRTYAVNEAKWNEAREYCKRRGWGFRIITEYDLGIKRKPI